MKIPVLVIGGGLSGLAAAIRVARFLPNVVLLEKHSRLGGLNSYFYRNKKLFETGLHAITNYAEPKDKSAPLNRLLRQLKIKRSSLSLCQQFRSEIVFKGVNSLLFTNDFNVFHEQVEQQFPHCADNFRKLLLFLKDFNPFTPSPFRSAKNFLQETLQDTLLVDMICCPLMYYGSSHEDDIDLSQFAIMFQAIFQEGMFRPSGTIKDFLELLRLHYESLGGKIKKNCGVQKIVLQGERATGVVLQSGEYIECDHIVSTIGLDETKHLCEPDHMDKPETKRMGFVESIYKIDKTTLNDSATDRTIIFYNDGVDFQYRIPEDPTNYKSGVICFPDNFHGISVKQHTEVRATHLANYDRWKSLHNTADAYSSQKLATSSTSKSCIEKIIGSFSANIIYENTFTPVTIERYTSKIKGAIYGSPHKIKDGNFGYSNLFLAGTDQGFLGIVGSMLSGVSIVNQHILPKL